MPLNIRRYADQILTDGKSYLLDVASFIRTDTIRPGKILSFFAKEVACIVKGKLGKPFEFGRVFQLGRIGGNFLIPLSCTCVRMEDKKSVKPFIAEHARLFGQHTLSSMATDKGYYSKKNCKIAFQSGISEVGIQCPKNSKLKGQQDLSLAKALKDRRAGIEALIGHAKNFGLRKSRMKSDTTTLASGYRSILGFNLRQIERHILGEFKKVT